MNDRSLNPAGQSLVETGKQTLSRQTLFHVSSVSFAAVKSRNGAAGKDHLSFVV